MEPANFTEGVNQQALGARYCSAELTGDVHSELTCLSVVNTFLSITAFLGNTLILVALRKETSLHPPSKLLYRNLAITDLCVGIFVEPLVVFYWTSVGERKMGYLLLHRLCRQFGRLYFVYRLFINIDCNKRGQTTRLVAGAQIQTTCNFKKNVHNCHRFLDFVHCWCI